MNTKTCTKCKLEKQFEFFSKCKGGRFGLKSECKDCSSLRFKKFYQENRDLMIQKTHTFRENNPDYSKNYYKKYYSENKLAIIRKSLIALKSLSAEKRSAKYKKYYLRNKSKVNSSNKSWRMKNIDKINFYSSIRRSRKKLATPKWLTVKDLEDIHSYYLLASELNKVSDVKFVVDHIVPLSNDNVCGLHVPWNLQLLTNSENCSKNNKFN